MIYLQLETKTTGQGGVITSKRTLRITVEDGPNTGAMAFLDAKQAHAFLDELKALVNLMPEEDA